MFDLWRTHPNVSTVCEEYVKAAHGGIGRLLTQFRLDLSPLNYQLYLFKINDNPFCPSCGNNFETLSHYFIDCHTYRCHRELLMQDLFEIFYKAGFMNNTILISANEILSAITNGLPQAFVTAAQNKCLNIRLFQSVKRYILLTKRFSSDFYF